MKWIVFALLLFATVASAQDKNSIAAFEDNGNIFLSKCDVQLTQNSSSDDAYQAGLCTSYVTGVYDGFLMAFDVVDMKSPICQPDGVTKGQIERIVKKYIREHPEKSHHETRILIVESLIAAFPCKTDKK